MFTKNERAWDKFNVNSDFFKEIPILSTIIVTYGSITSICGKEIGVTVSASGNSFPEVVTCTFLNFTSENFAITVAPFIGMRVLVLTMQKYHPDMFNSSSALKEMYNRPFVLTESLIHYSKFGAVCFPAAPDAVSDNNLRIDESTIVLSLESTLSATYNNYVTSTYQMGVSSTYESGLNEAFEAAVVRTYDGTVTETYGDNAAKTVTSTAAITVSCNGLSVDSTTDTITIKNDEQSLGALLKSLIDAIKGIITTGGPTTQAVSATSQTALDSVATDIEALFPSS